MDLDLKNYQQFIERAGDLMDEHGLPHMAGRVIGALMISKPPYLSHEELSEQLQASKGSISMSTQLLLRLNIVKRISLPGHRRHYYQLREQLWNELLSTRAEFIQKHVALAEAGLVVLADEPGELKMRIVDLLVFSDFILEMLPLLNDQWEQRRSKLTKERLAQIS